MTADSSDRKVLVLFAHPAMQKSRVNRRLLSAIGDLPGVTVHDLYEAYPELHVNVRHEQALLDAHDVIVFQHPLYWYSTPALLKEYKDLVLEHGWAYGHDGAALRGKRWLTAVTVGGSRASYSGEGGHGFTLRQLLAPIEATARLCAMEFLPPFVVFGTFGLDDDGVARQADTYRQILTGLRDGTLDLRGSAQPYLNDHLPAAGG